MKRLSNFTKLLYFFLTWHLPWNCFDIIIWKPREWLMTLETVLGNYQISKNINIYGNVFSAHIVLILGWLLSIHCQKICYKNFDDNLLVQYLNVKMYAKRFPKFWNNNEFKKIILPFPHFYLKFFMPAKWGFKMLLTKPQKLQLMFLETKWIMYIYSSLKSWGNEPFFIEQGGVAHQTK